MPRRRRKPVLSRPRVPLLRQTGGAHVDKTKRSYRKRKHKKAESEE